MGIENLDAEEQYDYEEHTGFSEPNWGFDPIDLDEDE